MPKGIKVDDQLIIEKFKKKVANQLPFSLKINKNYSRFDLILQKTETEVSVSTLKRLLYESDVTFAQYAGLDMSDHRHKGLDAFLNLKRLHGIRTPRSD